jgi:hypothetical protein
MQKSLCKNHYCVDCGINKKHYISHVNYAYFKSTSQNLHAIKQLKPDLITKKLYMYAGCTILNHRQNIETS